MMNDDKICLELDMKTPFDEWFDKKYPEGSLGQPILRKAFHEVAEQAWDASRCQIIKELDNPYGA